MHLRPPSYCEHLIDRLLSLVAPEEGCAALALRHPATRVYFPLRLVPGSKSAVYADHALAHYHLLSAELDSTQETEICLTGSTPLDHLVLQGKLAVQLFPDGPVVVQSLPCDSGGEVVLCRLTPGTVSPSAPSDITTLCHALGDATHLWQHVSALDHRIGEGDATRVAREVALLITDALPHPPHFPILFAAVDWRKRQLSDETRGQWHTNALSHNCFLLAERRSLIADYIARMVKTPADGFPYDDDLSHLKGGLLGAITSVCTDVVCLIGSSTVSDARVYVRRNVPRVKSGEAMPNERPFQHPPKVLASNWQLLRAALSYLQLRHGDSALVTAWASASANGQPPVIVPIGFVPGQQHGALAAAAEILTRSGDIKSVHSGTTITAWVVPLSHTTAPSVDEKRWEETAEQIESVLAAARAVMQESTGRFPGPYVLDFNNGNDLIITSPTAPPTRRIVSRHEDERLWVLLKALWTQHAEHRSGTLPSPVLASASIKAILGRCRRPKDGRADSLPHVFIDRMQTKLKTGSPPVDYKLIFANKRGEGWYWTGDSTAKGLQESVSAGSSDYIEQPSAGSHRRSGRNPGQSKDRD